MNTETVNRTILAVEKSVDTTRLVYRGEEVWPLIRMSIYLSFKHSKEQTGGSKKRLKFLVEGFFGWLLYGWRKILASPVDSLFLTSSHYKVKEKGKVYDRIINPFIVHLERKAISFRVLDFSSSLEYASGISYHQNQWRIQPVIYFLSWLDRFRFWKKRRRLEGDVKGLNDLLKQSGVNFCVNGSYTRKLETIYRQSVFFERMLKRFKVARVFVVCYYDAKGFSMVWACNRAGVKVIDLQHGVQGPGHMAYSHWPENLVERTRLLPTHFWTWDNFSYNNIARWKSDRKHILLGCNKWFLERIEKKSSDIILVTLQPIENSLPDYLLEAIRNYTGTKQWYIRLHPYQVAEMHHFQHQLQVAGAENKVNIKEATSAPLTELLSRTSLHITFFSSVAIEAYYFNVPTLFLDRRGPELYGEQLPEEYILSLDSGSLAAFIGQWDFRPLNQSSVAGEGIARFAIIDNFVS